MKDLIIEIIKIVTPISVALMVFSAGLGIAPRQVGAYFKERPWLIVRALAAALILVPAAALALILILKPPLPVAIGLAILVSCPPASLMILATPKLGKGSAPFMATLHLCLATLAIVTVPATLDLISRPLGFRATVHLGSMAWILARTIVLPLLLGMTVRAFAGHFADQRARAFALAGNIGLAAVVLIAVVALFPALLKMEPRSYLVMAVVSATALAIGELLGPADRNEKTSMAVECGVRHPTVALTIGISSFSQALALPVLVACILTFILVAVVYLAVVRGRQSLAPRQAATPTA
jgi:bile acid:Na+ symporter, BASS family